MREKDDSCRILRERRMKLGLTPQDIGEAVGIAPQRYIKYEDGRMNPMKASFDVMSGLLLLLNLDPKMFYRGEYHVDRDIDAVDYMLSQGASAKEEGVKVILRNKVYDVDAMGIYTRSNHLVVLRGSRISINSYLEEKGWLRADKLRKKLIDKKVIQNCIFTSDCAFHSPSEAAKIICGRHLSGTNVWFTEEGVRLGKLKKN